MYQKILFMEASNNGPKYEKKYKCSYCDERHTRKNLPTHIQRKHEDMIPEGFTALRVAFNIVNKKTEGHCIICQSVTAWNEMKGRYERLCGKKSCTAEYIKIARKRNRDVLGTDCPLRDPRYKEELQKKMLASRKISGEYRFSDGGMVGYTGTYEKKCLEFMDKIMHIESIDIQSPGPIIHYMHAGDNQEHMYISDFLYVPYNLIIEVKDGGDNPNNRQMDSYRQKQLEKEQAVRDDGTYNYLRLTNNNFSQLMEVMALLKMTLIEDPDQKIVKVNEMSGPSNTAIIGTSKSDTFMVQHLQNNVYSYSITKDPTQTEMIFIDRNQKKAKKISKKDIGPEYVTFKLRDQDLANNVWEEAVRLLQDGTLIEDPEYFYYNYTRKNILSPSQIYFDESCELIRNFDDVLEESNQTLYDYLTKTKPIDILEEQVSHIHTIIETKLSNILDNSDDIHDIEMYPFTEIIPDINHSDNDEAWENALMRARHAEELGLLIMVDTTVPSLKLREYGSEAFDILENKWNNIKKMPADKRVLSDQIAYNIFGYNNINLYTKIKNFIIQKLEQISHDTELAEAAILNESVDTEYHKEEFEFKPFFTPDEMSQFGVFSGEINLYSPYPDNELIGNRTVVEWFKDYQNTCKIDNMNEWFQCLTKLYSDYQNIMESGNKNRIAARKQSILELGWNPEIPFNQELLHRAYYKNDIMVEGYIFSKDNLYINFDQFESGKTNICFVTGLSGSGKSTLGKSIADKYKAEWVELDLFEQCYGFTDDQLKEAGVVFYDYLSSHKELWEKLKKKEIKGENLEKEVSKFLKYAISWAHRQKGKYIFEGVQIYSSADPSYMKSQPIIFVNASMVKSIIQRFKRNGDGKIEWKEELKNEFPQLLRWYIDNEKAFQKFQKAILSEHTILQERVKDVKFDEKGNIRIKTIEDVNTEFFKCHRNLISFEKAGNYESMKNELCKLKYLDNFAIRHMKNKESKDYKQYADAHARITNDFNKYLKLVTEYDPNFNFSEYFKKSEWYDEEVVVSKGLLEFLLGLLKKVLTK